MINYDIYQLKDDPSLHSIRFANTKFMNTHNIPIDAGNYDKVYSGNVDNESAAGKKSTDEVLESLYEKFNMRHPADFRGHSLSVSDVVVLHDNGVVTAHFCDSYGFTQIPEFIQPDAFVNLDSSGIAVSGHYGTWHTLESHNIQGREFYLMESDEFGRDAANVIVDGTGKLVAEDVLTGFTPEIVQMITEEQQLAPHLTNLLQDEEISGNELVLSPSQEQVLEDLWTEYQSVEGPRSALLYGITGSGKTSVFLKLIERVREQGKGVIVMVPEISLTAQTIRQFHRWFGDGIALFHSGLSLGERLDEWKRVRRGEATIVVGTRSAVFAPVRDLGLIVMDEEQEHTYKSESSPRYDAREVARYRCWKAGAFCLFSSATPSVETCRQAQEKRIGFHKLDARFGDAVLPQVELVDMNQDAPFGETAIGPTMAQALKENFQAGRQSILLLNRRGYHTFASCQTCHEVVSCPHCSISLTYHSANGRLMCHYCGYSVPFSRHCPSCGSDTVTFRGAGTQKAEEQLQQLLPQARVLRIDTDSVAAKFSLEKKLDQFARGEYDIMVGTQMVAKGLDFEKVTLVGVLSADQALFSDDFRSNERTFDLLTQVVGRAGRGKYPGRAIIQTYAPENPVLHLAADQDYFGFYRQEIAFRQAMLYPPFVDILVIGFVGEKELLVKQAAEMFLRILSQLAREEYGDLPLRVLRPSPAAVAKVSNKYRYKLLIKCRNTSRLQEMISRLLIQFASLREFQPVTAYADPNPYWIL